MNWLRVQVNNHLLQNSFRVTHGIVYILLVLVEVQTSFVVLPYEVLVEKHERPDEFLMFGVNRVCKPLDLFFPEPCKDIYSISDVVK